MSFVANYNSNSPEPNSPEPLDTIEKAIQDKFKEYFKPSENYKITFTFEGTDNETKEYSTIFKFSYSGITNNCITISYKLDDIDDDDSTQVSSMIRSNSDKSHCFTPSINIKANLPTGITQTDILQVLNTKLKILILGPDKDVTLADAAIVKDSRNGKISAPLSYWRVVRGEEPIYAKYAYWNKDFFDISRFARERRWSEYIGDENIDNLLKKEYPDITIDKKDTIAKVMKKMGEKQTENMSKIVMDVFNKITYKMAEIYNNSRLRWLGIPTYILIKTDRRWQNWNKLLKIVSFEQVKSDTNSNTNSNNETNTNNNGKTKPNTKNSNTKNSNIKNSNGTGGSRVRKTRRKYKNILRKKIKSRSTKKRI